MVYVPAGPLLAYDELSGKLIWRGEGGAPDESASVANGVVYASSGEGPLALDAHTGKLLYLYTNTPYQGQSNSSSVVADGMVFFMMSYGYIDALKLP